MLRAIFATLVMVTLVLAVGTMVLVAGLVYRSRRFFAASAAFWGRLMLRAAGVRLAVTAQQPMNDGRPRLFIANHQSALDIPILLAALDGDVRFMAKRSLFRIPLFGWVMHQAGFVPIDRSSARATAATLERMLAQLRRDPISLVVFPEGTRTYDGLLKPFRRGSVKVAQRCGLPVVPVTIDGSFAIKPRNRFAVRPGPVRVVFHKPLSAEEVAATPPNELHKRIVGTIAHELGQPPPAPGHEDSAEAGKDSESIGAAPRST